MRSDPIFRSMRSDCIIPKYYIKYEIKLFHNYLVFKKFAFLKK